MSDKVDVQALERFVAETEGRFVSDKVEGNPLALWNRTERVVSDVQALERFVAETDSLCGEIIATLVVNLERGRLPGYWQPFVDKWRAKRNSIRKGMRTDG